MNLFMATGAQGHDVARFILTPIGSFYKAMGVRMYLGIAAKLASLLADIKQERFSATVALSSLQYKLLIMINAVTLRAMRLGATWFSAGLFRAFHFIARPALPTTFCHSTLRGNKLATINARAVTTPLSGQPHAGKMARPTEIGSLPFRLTTSWTRVLIVSLLHSLTSTQILAHTLSGCKEEVLLSQEH